MDISALQKQIGSDVSSNRTPLFLIADTGSSLCGQVDNILRLQDVCRANAIWLHCRGHSLAAIAVTHDSSGVMAGGEVKPIADSISLNLGSWLGLPNLPVAVSSNYPSSVSTWRSTFSIYSFYTGKSKIMLCLSLNRIRCYRDACLLFHSGLHFKLLVVTQFRSALYRHLNLVESCTT